MSEPRTKKPLCVTSAWLRTQQEARQHLVGIRRASNPPPHDYAAARIRRSVRAPPASTSRANAATGAGHTGADGGAALVLGSVPPELQGTDNVV